MDSQNSQVMVPTSISLNPQEYPTSYSKSRECSKQLEKVYNEYTNEKNQDRKNNWVFI